MAVFADFIFTSGSQSIIPRAFLIRPYYKPDIKCHNNSKPHTNSNSCMFWDSRTDT